MSDMSADRALDIFVQTARNNVQSEVDTTMTVIKTGRGKQYRDPFKGGMSELPIPEELQPVLAKLQAAGLTKDQEFVTALETWLTSVSSAPIFHLFSAMDGEGAYAEEGVWYELHARGVGRLETCLHEKLYPIGENLLKD